MMWRDLSLVLVVLFGAASLATAAAVAVFLWATRADRPREGE